MNAAPRLCIALALAAAAQAAASRAETPQPTAPAPAEIGNAPRASDGPAPLPPPKSGAVSLREIYEAALEADQTLAAAEATLRAGKEEGALGLAGLLPQIDGGANYEEAFAKSRGEFPAGGQTFPNLTDTDRDTKAFSFTLRQPVFDLSAWFRFRRGQELSEQAEATFAAEQQELIVRVTDAYFAVLRARAVLRAAQAQEEAFEAQLEQTRQRYDAGATAMPDVHEAQAAYDLAIAERLAAEGQVGSAIELLAVLTGQRHRDVWRLSEDYPVSSPEPADSDAWVDFARENNYDIKAAARARAAARKLARAAAAEHLPKIDVRAGYSESEVELVQDDLNRDLTNRFPADRDDRFLSLNVEVPIFSGGAISAERRRAAAQFDGARHRHVGTIRRVEQQTRSQFIAVSSDAARVRARRQAIVSSRSALEATRAGYRAGTRDIVDVIDAQRSLFAAQRDFDTARIEYVNNLVRLKRLAGTLSPGDIQALNRWMRPPEAEAEETPKEQSAGQQ